MPDATRVLTWCQGNVLTDECALELKLCSQDEIGSKFFVVVSHDCDLAATTDKEPKTEVVAAESIQKLGANSHSKNARRLDLEFQHGTSVKHLMLFAISKQFVNKDALFQFQPRSDLNLNSDGLRILQRWLASRYNRAAFPELFENHLRNVPKKGKKSFLEQIEAILGVGSKHIRGLYFDLDEGQNIERESPDDCYSLGITVLYYSSLDEPVAAEAAKEVAMKLDALFSEAFYAEKENKWQSIELRYCDEVSDSVQTVAQGESLKQWRLEHMSLREPPAQVMTTE